MRVFKKNAEREASAPTVVADNRTDKVDLLSGVALVAMAGSVVTLFVHAMNAGASGTTLPLVSAGLVAGALILFRQWRKSVHLGQTSAARSQYLINHDPVTLLPNHAGVVALLEQQRRAALEAGDDPAFGAIVCVGLSRLQEIYDNLGQDCGDAVLLEISSRLQGVFDDVDRVARVGEDVFAIVVGSLTKAKLAVLSGQLNRLMDMPVPTPAGTVVIGSAVGVSFPDANCTDPREAIRQARLALSAARNARAAVAFFEPEFDQSSRLRLELTRELRAALVGGGLSMVYQPQVNEKGDLVGVEALMRWSSPTRGEIPPSVFIPLGEQADLGEALGLFALGAAFRDSRRWDGLKVAVNVSPVQLRSAEFVPAVKRLLDHHQVRASGFELEITEGVLLDPDPAVSASLDALRGMGFSIALDDFGTGYSSLGYLSQFEVDKIKIDRSFVVNLGVRPDATAIIKAITDLADALGVKVLAEGVENGAQLKMLRGEGCNLAQGFFVGRPMPAEAIDTAIKPEVRSPDRSIAA
jgi:diguanylate cyclase (GGDEF)-like protein